MAKGYPDYFGYSIFAHYGTPLRQLGNTGVIAGGGEADLLDVNAKGRIIGGNIRAWTTDGEPTFSLQLKIDGNDMSPSSPFSQLDFNICAEGKELIYLSSYDQEAKWFIFGISSNVTFSNRLYLKVLNGGIVNISVSALLFYNLVQ